MRRNLERGFDMVIYMSDVTVRPSPAFCAGAASSQALESRSVRDSRGPRLLQAGRTETLRVSYRLHLESF